MEYFRPSGKNSAVNIALLAIMAALVTIMTLVIRIPYPGTSGYFNFGDIMVSIWQSKEAFYAGEMEYDEWATEMQQLILDKLEEERQRHEFLSTELPFVDREEAKKRLIKQVAELAKEHGFSYNHVFIRNQRTRWGSCSAKNNINLNIKLASLPHDLADYVILHELVHTRIKNHSKTFWEALGRLMKDAKAADRRLKAYRLALI